ncbi:hypothetical protein ACI2I2_23715 [Scandinavium sp. NPDC088450]|uniref:hypothetical protein n=1 Tax=Scandinavium sp. NPDC088450 TaxID=3364514 RepID=UPI00384E97E9
MKLTNSLPNFFITHTITQTNVHDRSRSIYAQSVNENSYDYNSTNKESVRQMTGKMLTNMYVSIADNKKGA